MHTNAMNLKNEVVVLKPPLRILALTVNEACISLQESKKKSLSVVPLADGTCTMKQFYKDRYWFCQGCHCNQGTFRVF